MEMSLKLNAHISAFMFFEPSFFLFLLLLLKAFTNMQARGLVGWLGLRTNDIMDDWVVVREANKDFVQLRYEDDS